DSLFMNYALFGNLGNYGNSSAYYFLQDTNCHPQTFTMHALFANFHLSSYAGKYSSDLRSLQTMYQQISKYGTMFLIAISPNKLSNVHVTVETGEKSSVSINGKETSDTKIIYDALLDNLASVQQSQPLPIRNAD